MVGKEKVYRIRKTTKPKKLSDDTEEIVSHYLSFWRNGLRIVVSKFLPTGEVHVVLVRGKEGSKSFKEFKRYKLQVPSQHQIDVQIGVLLKNLGLLV